MPKKARQPFRCRCCGTTVNFALVVARIRTVFFNQVYAHSWKPEPADPAEFDFEEALFVSCPSCGLMLKAPASIVSAYNRITPSP